ARGAYPGHSPRPVSRLLTSAQQPVHATSFVVAISLLPFVSTVIQKTRSVREARLAERSIEVGHEQDRKPVFSLKKTVEPEHAQGLAGNRRGGCLPGFGPGGRGLRLIDHKRGQDERRQDGRRQDGRRQDE